MKECFDNHHSVQGGCMQSRRSDEYQMINHRRQFQRAKIALAFSGIKEKIDQARNAGKVILYLPGSYDLVHEGHDWYHKESIIHYITTERKTRSEIYVVILADSESLVSVVKRNKWKPMGGTEEFRRPVQRLEAFSDCLGFDDSCAGIDPRLIDLSTFEVDMVGIIPGPLEMDYTVIPPAMAWKHLETDFESFVSGHPMMPLNHVQKMKKILREFPWLTQNFLQTPEVIKSDFRTELDAVTPELCAVHWRIQTWQLLIHSYLASGEFNAPFVRIMSNHDADYHFEIEFLMSLCGITMRYFTDRKIITTTELLGKNGRDRLLKAKRSYY